MKILDLGCGDNKVEGAIGLDNIALSEVDIVHDLLDFPYPIENESYDIIYLRNVIEHFNQNDIDKIFNECYRIMVPKGLMYVMVPHAFTIAAFTDPTHKSYFTFLSGDFWDKTNSRAYYTKIDAKWTLESTKCSALTWFDWKRFRLTRLDRFLATVLKKRINRALKKVNNPSLADRIIGKYSFQFVEILWLFRKDL